MAAKKRHTGPMRVLGYVRVSTDEQTRSGAGLIAQRDAIAQACKARGYRLLDIIEDAGVSGKSLKRPGIKRALVELDDGRADALMVAKLDRLSRSTLDFAGLLERARQTGWTIVALDNGGSDMTTPQGEAMAGMSAVFAQLERRLISQRTKEGMAAKRAQGVRFGRARTLSDDVVGRIVSERSEGRTLRAIADGLNADGVPTARGGVAWQSATIFAVLKSVERDRERAAILGS